MADQVTRVTQVGIFSALAQSFKNVLGGAGLFILAFPIMFWNECNSVQTARSLDEGLGAVVSVSADSVDAANEGALIHISGNAQTSDTLSDADFMISVQALLLERDVEMYQWEEKSSTKTEGNTKTTTYTYRTTWADDLIDSSRFEERQGHSNPSSMLFEDRSYAAQTVTLGAFTLSGDQLQRLSASTVYTPESSPHTIHDGYLYINDAEPGTPEVGDVRVQFTVLEPGPMSVVSQQAGTTFTPFPTSAGRNVSLIQTGTHSAESMFADAQAANVVMTWVLRIVAFFMVFGGMNLVIGPLRVVGERVPLVGRIFGAGMTLVTFFLSSALTLVTISVAWIVARPLLGIALLLLGGGAFIGAAFLIFRVSKAQTA